MVAGPAVVVDVEFRDRFYYMGLHGGTYSSCVAALPQLMIATMPSITAIIKMMANVMEREASVKGHDLPPWRRRRALYSNWLPERFTDDVYAPPSAALHPVLLHSSHSQPAYEMERISNTYIDISTSAAALAADTRISLKDYGTLGPGAAASDGRDDGAMANLLYLDRTPVNEPHKASHGCKRKADSAVGGACHAKALALAPLVPPPTQLQQQQQFHHHHDSQQLQQQRPLLGVIHQFHSNNSPVRCIPVRPYVVTGFFASSPLASSGRTTAAPTVLPSGGDVKNDFCAQDGDHDQVPSVEQRMGVIGMQYTSSGREGGVNGGLVEQPDRRQECWRSSPRADSRDISTFAPIVRSSSSSCGDRCLSVFASNGSAAGQKSIAQPQETGITPLLQRQQQEEQQQQDAWSSGPNTSPNVVAVASTGLCVRHVSNLTLKLIEAAASAPIAAARPRRHSRSRNRQPCPEKSEEFAVRAPLTIIQEESHNVKPADFTAHVHMPSLKVLRPDEDCDCCC